MYQYLILVNRGAYVVQEADTVDEAIAECRANWLSDGRSPITDCFALAVFNDLGDDSFVVGSSV